MLEEFTRKTGIKVNESNYSSNEELLAKLQAGATGFDLAVPSDYMVSVMAKLALVQELDKSQIPNAANLDPKFLGKSYDPENKVSLPYGWAITGFAVNRSLYDGPAASWGDLLQNDKVKGRVSLLDDVREALATALKLQGFSLNTTNPDELARAKALLAAAKKNIKAFNSTPADLLTAGEVLIAQMYSTEALVAARDSGKKIEFVIPKEGATVAIDNLVLLKGAPHPRAAYALMNFFYEKAVNADLVTRMFAGPVVAGVRDVLPPAVRDNKSLFPSEEELARCEMMEDLGAFTSQYDRAWSEIKAASH
jgi:spermidine/putrescine transport system substrate-binding protein